MRNDKLALVLGISGAARELGRSEATVRTMADRGTLPSVRDSAGRRLFSLTDVRAVKAKISKVE